MENTTATVTGGSALGAALLGGLFGFGLFVYEAARKEEKERKAINELFRAATSPKRAWRKVMAMRLGARHRQHFRRLLDECCWHNPYDTDHNDGGRGADLSWLQQLELGGEG